MIPLCGWTGLDFIIWNSAHLQAETILFLYRLQIPFYMLIGSYSFRFVYTMLGKEKDFFYKNIIWPPWFITIIGIFTDVMTKGHNPTSWGVIHEAGSWFVPAIFIGTFIPGYASIILLFFSVKKAPNNVIRNQRLIILLGILFVPSVSIITNIILPWILAYKQVIQLGSCTVSVNAVIIHIAILKYDLLPISVERTLNELFNRSEYGVVIFNRYNDFVEMNSAAEVLLDCESTIFRHSSLKEAFKESLIQKKDKQQFFHTIEKSTDKTYLKIEHSAYHEKEKFLGTIFIIKDITTEKRAEESIIESNKILEEKVLERTKNLQDSQQTLIQQKNALEKVSRYKSEFIANLSHEIRTPLNGIVGFSELIAMDKDLSHQHHQQVHHIKTCSNSLLELINSILDYSKIDAKKMTLKLTSINLSDLISQVVSNYQITVEESKPELEIIINSPDLEYKYYIDSLRLKQVLNNLLSNAIKFTQQGYIKIDIDHTHNTEEYDSLRFSVTDSGKGVSETEGPRIFNAFEQGDGSSTRRYGGTGLGLSISKNLVTLMGGNLELTHFGNIDGIGACFTFELSLKRGEKITLLTETQELSIHKKPSKTDTHDSKNIKILMAEDNEFNQLMQKAILEKQNYHVTIAENGQLACEYIQQDHYDLILMDMQMPILSGTDATIKIRQMGYTQPIIAMTANAYQEDQQLCLEAGMDSFLTKPLDIDQLIAEIEKFSTRTKF